jgi:hypothetical protein
MFSFHKKKTTEKFAAAASPAVLALRGAASARPWHGRAHSLDGQKSLNFKKS